MSEEEVALLRDIRGLLEVLAEASLPQYAEVVHQRLGANIVDEVKTLVGTSDRQWLAVSSMDGTRSRADISKLADIEGGNLSRFTKKLIAAKIIEDRDGMLLCKFNRWELQAIRRS